MLQEDTIVRSLGEPGFADKFWSRVNKTESCWLWIGPKARHGYGRLWLPCRMAMSAHRVAWRLANGAIPGGMEILHKCDNPPCVNPGHLLCGTHAQNMRDSLSKGRIARGHKNGRSKLVESDIEEIVRLKNLGLFNYQIGARYGVGKEAIRNIVNGATWKHCDREQA